MANITIIFDCTFYLKELVFGFKFYKIQFVHDIISLNLP